MRRRAPLLFRIVPLLVLAACAASGGSQEVRPPHLNRHLPPRQTARSI